MCFGVVYKTTCVVNGKIYIGQTIKRSIYYRGGGKSLSNAIRKYGVHSFVKEVLEECGCREDLDDRERYWIKYFNSTNKSIGYNIATGGNSASGYRHSEETKRKMGESRKGRIVSEETRLLISLSNTGKKRSRLTCERLRAALKGKPISEERRIKRRGEGSSRAKLTEAQVLWARDQRSKGVPYAEIMPLIPVGMGVLVNAVMGRTWSHLPNAQEPNKYRVSTKGMLKHSKKACKKFADMSRGENNNIAKLDNKMVMRARAQYADGWSLAKITRFLGITVYITTIRNAVYGNTWAHLPNAQVARKVQTSDPIKLTESKVMCARERYTNGELVSLIAKDLSVNRQSLSLAILGRTWAHLPNIQKPRRPCKHKNGIS